MSDENLPRSGASTPPPDGGEPAAPDGDERDEVLGSMLAVDELDEVTRRRLVQKALDDADAYDADRAERRFGRRAAVLGVAAALVIGALVGTVIVTQPDDATTTERGTRPTDDRGGCGGEGSRARRCRGHGLRGSQRAGGCVRGCTPGRPRRPRRGSRPGEPAGGDQRAPRGRDELERRRPDPVPGHRVRGAWRASTAWWPSTPRGRPRSHGDSVVVLIGTTQAGASVAVVLDVGRGCAFVRNVPL